MTPSCEAIVIILTLIMLVFIRKKKYHYAISLIPLYFVPLAQIVSDYSIEYFAKLLGFDSHNSVFYLYILIAMIGVVITVICFAFRFFSNHLIRNFYTISVASFSVILSLILLFNI